MTNTERDQINRRFAKLVGLKIHEHTVHDNRFGFLCSCGKYNCSEQNPDFISHPTLVLREIELKRPEFIEEVFCIDETSYHDYATRRVRFGKLLSYILDETEGLLVKAAIEWLEKEEGK